MSIPWHLGFVKNFEIFLDNKMHFLSKIHFQNFLVWAFSGRV